MKITNTGKVRRRVEGYGYVEPNETITVPESVGLELRKLRDFREERASKPTPKKTKSKGRQKEAETDNEANNDINAGAAEAVPGGDEHE